MQVTTIGPDLAKNFFRIHGVNAEGKAVIRKAPRRALVLPLFAPPSPCLIGLEA